jgi:hypothetical protein
VSAASGRVLGSKTIDETGWEKFQRTHVPGLGSHRFPSLRIAAAVERDAPGQQCVRLILPRLRSTSVRMALRSCCPNRTEVWCRRVIHEGTRYLGSCNVFVRLQIMRRTICFALMLYRVSQEECARLRENVPNVKVHRYDSCHTLIDYQIHIKTGRNMWFL